MAIVALSKVLGCSESALQNTTLSTVSKNTIIFEVGDLHHELVYLFRGELQEMAFSGTNDEDDADVDIFAKSTHSTMRSTLSKHTFERTLPSFQHKACCPRAFCIVNGAGVFA